MLSIRGSVLAALAALTCREKQIQSLGNVGGVEEGEESETWETLGRQGLVDIIIAVLDGLCQEIKREDEKVISAQKTKWDSKVTHFFNVFGNPMPLLHAAYLYVSTRGGPDRAR